MRFQRLLVPVLLLMVVGAVAAEDDRFGLPDFAAMTNPKATAWTTPLMPIFDSAAKEYNVPLPLLLTLGYFGSAFENRYGAPTIEGGYGVMALRDNKTGGNSLIAGALLVSSSTESLQLDPALNIKAAAVVLSSYARRMKINRAKGLEAWIEPVIKYAGLDEECSKFFAAEIFGKLQKGMDCTNNAGERFVFSAQSIGSVDLDKLMPSSIKAMAGYSGAIWYPAASCNYTASYSAKDTVVCHTIEGSAAGCLSWFRNCSAQVSAHYVVSEAGTVWQCVDENYIAWHVSCYNYRSIGLEHEGYAASSSHPASLYNASALCVRDVCNRWGIPKEKRTVGPGILGHIDITRCCCGTHTDPGNGWDWSYYIGQVQGTPPPPSYAAHYNAQSYPATMTAGSTAIAWAEYVNDGTATWGHAATRLGTSSPQDRLSPFYNSANWISASRPTEVDQSAVTTGQVGRFTFILKAPTAPGVYVEKYRPVQEGVTWFGGEVTWTITVVAAQGNITGTVRNAANGQALSAATVAISGGPSTTTNTSGVYTFNNLDPATYTLSVSKAGFSPASGTAAVTAGQTTTKDFNLTSTDATPPSNPSGLTATGISPSQINLSWTASTDTGGAGLAGYIIYRNSAEVGRTTATTYQDNGLTQNTSYSYFVKAYDNANNVSGASNTASAGTLPGTVPIFEDGFASINGALWSAIVQSPMSGPNPLVWDGGVNHGTFPGGGSIRSVDSGVSTQGCLLGHTFNPGFGAAKFESWFYDSSASNNSRQGLQVRCLDGGGGVKAIYYLGTYSAAPGSFSTYSAGYYKVCGVGCTGWYWPGAACKARVVGWHKFTIDFQPYTGAGNEVKFYIDGILVCTTERTLDTQTYGLNMVAYGYHYRVNVEGWFDDCAMYASAPTVPTMVTAAALSSSSIRWNVTDTSNNEIGFRILDAAQTIKASATVSNGTGAIVAIDEGGLTANTPYTRYAKSYNGTLNSLSSAAATRWTLAATSNVTCDRSTGIWYQTPGFTFTATGGFGQGTVSQYAYAWDDSPAHSWTGAEPVWNSGDLILVAPSSGSYYLHVRGFNGEGVAGGALDLGPFDFDDTPPINPTAATETGGAVDDQWQSAVSDPAFTWSGASDVPSGIAGYLVYFGDNESATSDTLVTEAAYDPAAVTTGTYYLRTCAKDNAGNPADEWKTIFTFKYDSSGPDAPTVADDGQYTGSSSALHGTWRATDADSGIAEYEYAVGTSAGGADIVGWTSAGSDGEAVISIPPPGLSTGTTYYISAKAKNGAGSWSDVASSDGIQLAAESLTISAAKALIDTTPVGLKSKVVTASFANSYYIQESDRSSGILVLGQGPDSGAIVTVGGIMGVNAMGERAILEPVTTVESASDPGRVPKALYLPGRNLGGEDFNPLTPGLTDGSGLNNIGLLVQVTGTFESVGENEFFVNDGSQSGPMKVIAAGIDLGTLTDGDTVIVTGISSLELDGAARKTIIRLSDSGGIAKKN